MNKKTNQTIPLETSIYMRYLHQHGNVKISEIVKLFFNFSKRSIYRHCQKEVNPAPIQDKRKDKGRPLKLDERAEQKIIREIPRLREHYEDSFTAKKC